MSGQESEEEAMSYTEEGEINVGFLEPYNTWSRAETRFTILQDPPSTNVAESSGVPKKVKIRKRCKFWPACKNEGSCTYHHPTTPCKAFPKCRFAERCFFIHPYCKYDGKCTKAGCPYAHVRRRMPVRRVRPACIPPLMPPCRYFPACKNSRCPFFHPKEFPFKTQDTKEYPYALGP